MDNLNSGTTQATRDKQPKHDGFAARKRSHKQRQAKNEQDEDPFMAYDQYYKNSKGFAKPKRGADINVNVTITL